MKTFKPHNEAKYRTRIYLSDIKNVWRVCHPNMTEYQVMKYMLTYFNNNLNNTAK